MKTLESITSVSYHLLQDVKLSDEEQMAALRLLNTQIKKDETRNDALNVLLTINAACIPSRGVSMYYYYLIAKGYRLTARISGSQSQILKSAQAITQVFNIADEVAIKIKNPKYHFARVYTLFLTASWNNQVDKTAFTKTVRTLFRALKSFQTPSLLWLQNEIIAFAETKNLPIPSSIARV